MPKQALFAEEKFYRKAKFWRAAVGIGFLLLFAAAFWQEIDPLLTLMGNWLSRSPELIRPEAQILRDLVILMVNLVVVIAAFFLALRLVSQFVLPVITRKERRDVYSRLRSYISGNGGPAIFIKEAKVKAREEEMASGNPGVAFVDLCSAIALEKNWVPTGNRGWLSRYLGRLRTWLFGTSSAGGAPPANPDPPVRIEGPGIVFTNLGERIRGVADLRRQLRLNPSVSVATRDGFELRAPVWVLFTLGEQVETIPVTYVDGWEAENLRGIRINEATRVVEGFEDEFDPVDKAEIHLYTAAPWSAPLEPPVQGILPYLFFPGRVFAALYSQARNLVDGNVVHWADLPLRVAIETFRDMLSQLDYNNLYQPENPDDFPFFDVYQPGFSRSVRNQGVLAFQYISHFDGTPVNIGDVIHNDTMNIHPVTRLQTQKELRQRGIRVITAGFSELTPIHQGVRDQLVEYWRAGWKKAANLTEADAAYDALRIQTRARADAQSQMADTLLRIINLPADSKAILTMRVMQALENAASDPKTFSLLSKDVLSGLKNMRDTLT